jgi:outer membrane protein
VKTSFRLALAGAALLAAAIPVNALAQARPAASSTGPKPALPHKVGLIDMSHVFTNYQKLKDQREQLQKQFEADSAPLKELETQLKAIQEEMKAGTIAKGSEQWTAKEQEFTNLKAQMQAEASNLQREFIRKEVAVYKEIHAEVSKYVSMYAEARQYTLILRYQREPDAEAADDPNQVMNRINQLVVYHQAGDDVTDILLSELNKQYAKQTGRTAAAPAASRPTAR